MEEVVCRTVVIICSNLDRVLMVVVTVYHVVDLITMSINFICSFL